MEMQKRNYYLSNLAIIIFCISALTIFQGQWAITDYIKNDRLFDTTKMLGCTKTIWFYCTMYLVFLFYVLMYQLPSSVVFSSYIIVYLIMDVPNDFTSIIITFFVFYLFFILLVYSLNGSYIILKLIFFI